MLRLFNSLQWLNEQRYLYSMRTAFIAVMPAMIVGAFAVVLNQLPIPAYQSFMESVFGGEWRLFGGTIFNATTQIVTLFVVYGIGSNLAQWYNNHKRTQVHAGICGIVAMACYTAVSLPVDAPDSLPFAMVGATGLFVGMVVSVLAAEAFIRLVSIKRASSILSDDPNVAVPQSFASVMPTIVVVAAFALLRVVLVRFGVRDTLNDIVYAFLRAPYANSGDSFGTAMLFNFSSHLMWLFGIHGNNVLDGVAQGVFVPAMAENVAAAAAGLPAPNLVTKTLYDAFVYMGGSGTTLALLLALVIFGRARSNRTLMRYALPTAIFNINEPLIFGIPIVLSPIYAIPFVLTPMVMFLTTAGAMSLGWVPYTTVDVSWATPVFVSGYIATQSIAGVVLQVVNLALAVLIYAPFVRLGEKMADMRFERAYQELVATVTQDYDPTMRRLINRVDEVGAVARRLANHLGDAIAGGEMFLNYQPIVDSRTNTMHSVEALLRWRHPSYGMINPMVTVALAEEVERIDKLGLWIMEQAVAQRAQWTAQGMPDFHVSVNVSTQQLNAHNFHEQVRHCLVRHSVPPHQLQIEITETAALVENENTRGNLAQLNALGVTIAMDDFGVGHSSLLYLRTQPITTLKIDGSLSRDVVDHPANLEIIATIHDLCRLLGVSTIIEYVDNAEQLAKLRGIGVFLIQGYLYSAPLMGDEIPAFSQKLKAHAIEPQGETE